MGRIAKKVAAKFSRVSAAKIVNLADYLVAKRDAVELTKDLKGVSDLIKDGYDPLHAVYVSSHNLVSVIAEGLSALPEFRSFVKIAGDAEDEYLPGGPPMSPLTQSYFTSWVFYDLQFGPDRETIGSCIEVLAPIFEFSAELTTVITSMNRSRMGIYQHCGHQGSRVVLRDIVDDKTYYCHSAAGYLGKSGQLWFVRLMTPLAGLGDHHVVFTTPYVLRSHKGEWEKYFGRVVPKLSQAGPRTLSQSLELLFKRGLNVNHWNEYIFQAYYGVEQTSIHLTGIPDIPGSLPHSS